MTAICENLFRAIALESELYHLLPLLSCHEIDAAIIVKGLFSQKDISIEVVMAADAVT